MTQTATSGKSASSALTASAGGTSGGQAASTDTEEAVTITISADYQTQVTDAGVTHIFTTTVYDKRDSSPPGSIRFGGCCYSYSRSGLFS